jgi:hypothetical protein
MATVDKIPDLPASGPGACSINAGPDESFVVAPQFANFRVTLSRLPASKVDVEPVEVTSQSEQITRIGQAADPSPPGSDDQILKLVYVAVA